MIPIFVVAGYDALAGISAIWFGSCIGTMCSIILESKPYIDQKFCNATEIPELTTRFKVVLVHAGCNCIIKKEEVKLWISEAKLMRI